MIEPPESFARRLDRMTAAKVAHEIERRRRMVPIAEPRPTRLHRVRHWARMRPADPFDWPVAGLCCIVIALLPLWLWFDLGRW